MQGNKINDSDPMILIHDSRIQSRQGLEAACLRFCVGPPYSCESTCKCDTALICTDFFSYN